MKHFAVRLVIKVGTFGTSAEHPLHLRLRGELGIPIVGVVLAFGQHFQAAAV
jgi:hypothetical protein